MSQWLEPVIESVDPAVKFMARTVELGESGRSDPQEVPDGRAA